MIEFPLPEALFLATGALVLGTIMLVRGGNWMIDAAVYVARHFGIPPLLIGFTVVAFGTSLPELVVSVNANISNLPGIAVGNIIRSNIANILLIIGASALISTITADNGFLRRDLAVMVATTAAFVWIILTNNMSRPMGFIMIAALIGYTFYQYWAATHDKVEGHDQTQKFRNLSASFLFLAAGLAFIIVGAEFLVRGARISAEIIGVPDAVIGLTVIAVGTSLPELTTCLIAAIKGHNDIVIGNIVGSNVFNILMIMGTAAVIKPIPAAMLAPQMLSMDIWVMIGSGLLLAATLLLARRIGRTTGILFVCAYIGYVIGVYVMSLSGPQG